MIDERMYQLGSEPNAIRALFAYGLARKAEIGAEKVFDFSLGNPSIPAPGAVREAVLDLMADPAGTVHGYTPAQGDLGVRSTLAESINRRFGMEAQATNLYLTAGAAASLSISLRALASPGSEFIVVAPYFPEYRVWIEEAGCVCVEVPARKSDFQLDLAAIEAAVNNQTKGVIINSPNNPVGVVYPADSLRGLAEVLQAKQRLYGHAITVICDEPYREIVYDGLDVPYLPALYDNSIVCYSYSKSLSLPGERIGYIYVSERMDEADRVYTAVCGAGRALGFVCAPALFQQVIKRCVDTPADVGAYALNRAALTSGLAALGFEFIEPQGAFYLWVKALEPSAEAFAERAKAHELLLVPSTSFGCDGWVRIGYCVSPETIKASMPAFAALAAEYRKA
ncbi:MAG: pyridoxal phosphate-dependent aminotransferase [Coriobacteriaceae bacterium]|nr:pyridoxal phosphate-dependent aminotransferase [Coriobacteriaceae bacterium]